jgi:hypothetical protein
MSAQSEHLDRLMNGLGLDNHVLAARAGASRQTIWKLRNGYTRILPNWARRIAPHLGVPWHQLVDGTVSAPVGATSESELLVAFRSTDDQGREMLLRFARSLDRYAPARREAAE